MSILSLSHEVLSESSSVRCILLSERSNQQSEDLLSKAKALVLAVWQGTGYATTDEVAQYYEVSSEVIQKIFARNEQEFGQETKKLTGKALQDAKDILSIASRASHSLVWTARGMLRVGFMLTQSEVAKNVRDVVLNVVDSANPTQPKEEKSPADIFLESAIAFKAQEVRLKKLEEEQKAIALEQEKLALQQESQQTWLKGIDAELERLESSEGHYFSVVGYANIHGIKVGKEKAKALGIKASAYCRKHNLRKEMIFDSMFGKIGNYPQEALHHVFVINGLMKPQK